MLAQYAIPAAFLMVAPFLTRLLFGMLLGWLFSWKRLLVIYLAMGGSLAGLVQFWPQIATLLAAPS